MFEKTLQSFIVILFIAPVSYCFAAIITVDDNGPADFNTIQAAINIAVDGDTVLVKDGVYMGTGNRNIDFSGKTIILQSENGPTHCSIDCQSETVGFTLITSGAPVIQGFTIIHCSTPDLPVQYPNPSTPSNTTAVISLEYNTSNATIKNCIFTDNAACIYSWGANGMVANCAFYGNTAGSSGGAVGMSTNIHNAATFNVRNSIFWENEPTEIDWDFHTCKGGDHPGMSVEFSILESNWQNKSLLRFENCIYGQNPLFADPNNGNFHLKSQQGRWEASNQQWVKDNVTSPGVDLGDPNDDYSNELWPHGKRINAGAYGNTAEASLSVLSKGNPVDTNADDYVNFNDISLFSQNWATSRIPDKSDFNKDNAVDILDLSIFAQNWMKHNIDPVITLNKTEYSINEPIEVSFIDMPGNQFDWIGLCEKGATIEPYAGAMIQWIYTDGTQTGTAGIINNTVQFNGLQAGDYEIRLFVNETYMIVDRAFFSVN